MPSLSAKSKTYYQVQQQIDYWEATQQHAKRKKGICTWLNSRKLFIDSFARTSLTETPLPTQIKSYSKSDLLSEQIIVLSEWEFLVTLSGDTTFAHTTFAQRHFMRRTIFAHKTFPHKPLAQKDICPDVHLPIRHLPRWTSAHNTFAQKDVCPEIHLPKRHLRRRTFAQIHIYPEGHLPRRTFAQKNIYPERHLPTMTDK
jgi:hypothetical protein